MIIETSCCLHSCVCLCMKASQFIMNGLESRQSGYCVLRYTCGVSSWWFIDFCGGTDWQPFSSLGMREVFNQRSQHAEPNTVLVGSVLGSRTMNWLALLLQANQHSHLSIHIRENISFHWNSFLPTRTDMAQPRAAQFMHSLRMNHSIDKRTCRVFICF